jgi:hypothetical protein
MAMDHGSILVQLATTATAAVANLELISFCNMLGFHDEENISCLRVVMSCSDRKPHLFKKISFWEKRLRINLLSSQSQWTEWSRDSCLLSAERKGYGWGLWRHGIDV